MVLTEDVDPKMVIDGGEETVHEMYEAPSHIESYRQRKEDDTETKLIHLIPPIVSCIISR